MKTTIWHKLSEKKNTSTSTPIIGPPICFGVGWTSLGSWLKNNGVPMISLEVEVIFFFTQCVPNGRLLWILGYG